MPIWLTALCYNSLFPAVLISAALIGAIACGGIEAYHQLEPGNVHIGAPGKTKEPTKMMIFQIMTEWTGWKTRQRRKNIQL